MKAIISTFVITTLCGSLYAQETLSDRWKETQRLDLTNKPVSYTDTLRLLNITKDEMSIRKGSFSYKGQISNDVLQVGDLVYGIMKNEPNEIQLRDEEFIHIFHREVKDMTASDAVVSRTKIELPPEPVSVIDPALLNGTWEAYKRSSRVGPDKVQYKRLIRTLTFNEIKQGNYYGSATTDYKGGNIFYYIKEIKAPDIIAERSDDHLPQKLRVWRLTAEELVMEDEYGIVYYMKHFR